MASRTHGPHLGAPRDANVSNADVVDGIEARHVVRADSSAQVADYLSEATRASERVVVCGARSKLDWGAAPARFDTLLDISSISGLIEHRPGDLVARLRAGTRFTDAQRELAAQGQRLAIDEVVPGSTMGGIVATGASGPLRHGFGAIRDQLIGLEVVRPDGAVARAGATVVKNVAGYDLCKLYCGSLGTLGVITEVTFRLHPLPERVAYVRATCQAPEDVASVIASIVHGQAAPAAVELSASADSDHVDVVAALEGATAMGRAEELATSIPGDATVIEDAPLWWATLPGTTTLKAVVPLGRSADLVNSLLGDDALNNCNAHIIGSAGLGVLYVGTDVEEPALIAELLGQSRALTTSFGGTTVVLRAPFAVKAGLDVWGPVKGASLMASIKKSFDPGARLSPGRFVDGI